MADETLNEGWHRHYEETPFFSTKEVKNSLENFLEYAGYKLDSPRPIGFMKPDLVAGKSADGKRFEMIFMVRERLDDAVEAFRALAAAKCFKKDTVDYVLALPPVSEHYLIEFLIEKEEWFFPLKDHLFQIWLVNPEKETVDCLFNWPRDNEFEHFFSNPTLAGFTAYIANKANDKLLEEEGF